MGLEKQFGTLRNLTKMKAVLKKNQMIELKNYTQ